MKKFIRLIFSRVALSGIVIVMQALILIIAIWQFSNYFVPFYFLSTLISLLVVLSIINNRTNPAYKIAWIVPIIAFPIFGGLFYVMFGRNKSSRKVKDSIKYIENRMKRALSQDVKIINKLEQDNKNAANQSTYIYKYCNCPIYNNTTTEYLTPGEKIFERMLDVLQKAEKYIFLEYFIIEEGIMWNSILDILIEKAKQGLDVRVMYDDLGCALTLPFGYNKKLENLGIKCCVHNPFKPILSFKVNNRNHRKTAVIDGHTAFIGGINLADEYINAVEKFGYWKDASLVVHGDAVWSFLVMFLSLWECKYDCIENYEQFKPLPQNIKNFTSDSYVQPFTDSPFDGEAIGESVYLNLINSSIQYIYINTPYLILDNEMSMALSLAAKRGVDVRIVTPHIGDKWFVHSVTRSNYDALVECGVRIYEFTPGFMHSKTFVVDDVFAVVGTINLDYRSLYLHFESGIWLYKTKSVFEVKQDYINTLNDCQQITLEDCNNVKWYIRVCRSILKIFAPQM